MRILLDQFVPRPLRRLLPNHEVPTTFECGWATLTNGELLSAAVAAGFDVLVTTDTNLPHQQLLHGKKFAVLVLKAATNRMTDLSPLVPQALISLENIRAGEIVVILANAGEAPE